MKVVNSTQQIHHIELKIISHVLLTVNGFFMNKQHYKLCIKLEHNTNTSVLV